MNSENFDVVIVGAGAAGLACAATLTLEGQRVALVSETPEVAWNLRPEVVGGSRVFVQQPVWQPGWGGGNWAPLARRLNIPVQMAVETGFEMIVPGAGPPVAIFQNVSPSGLTEQILDLFGRFSPVPLESAQAPLEKIFSEILAMELRQVMDLSDVPLHVWLEDRDVDPIAQMLLYAMSGNVLMTTPQIAQEHVSVLGGLGCVIRGVLCGELLLVGIKPTPHDGLFRPMADAIEQRGASVLRGRKVAEVLFESDRAVGVALMDGQELRAPLVALATGTSRLTKILGRRPPDVQAAVDYDAQLPHEDITIFTELGKPVVTAKSFCYVPDETGRCIEALYPMHAIAPWTVPADKHFLIAQTFTPGTFETTQDAIVEKLNRLNDDLFPGFSDAIEHIHVRRHRHHWMTPMCHGPKLPRTSADVPGLWFVGDGTAPVHGLCGVETAAGAGHHGAMDILAGSRK